MQFLIHTVALHSMVVDAVTVLMFYRLHYRSGVGQSFVLAHLDPDLMFHAPHIPSAIEVLVVQLQREIARIEFG